MLLYLMLSLMISSDAFFFFLVTEIFFSWFPSPYFFSLEFFSHTKSCNFCLLMKCPTSFHCLETALKICTFVFLVVQDMCFIFLENKTWTSFFLLSWSLVCQLTMVLNHTSILASYNTVILFSFTFRYIILFVYQRMIASAI